MSHVFWFILAAIGWYLAGLYKGRYFLLHKEHLRDADPWMWKWVQNKTRPGWAHEGIRSDDLNDIVANYLYERRSKGGTEDESIY